MFQAKAMPLIQRARGVEAGKRIEIASPETLGSGESQTLRQQAPRDAAPARRIGRNEPAKMRFPIRQRLIGAVDRHARKEPSGSIRR